VRPRASNTTRERETSCSKIERRNERGRVAWKKLREGERKRENSSLSNSPSLSLSLSLPFLSLFHFSLVRGSDRRASTSGVKHEGKKKKAENRKNELMPMYKLQNTHTYLTNSSMLEIYVFHINPY
jgi:hypothetical protein